MIWYVYTVTLKPKNASYVRTLFTFFSLRLRFLFFSFFLIPRHFIIFFFLIRFFLTFLLHRLENCIFPFLVFCTKGGRSSVGDRGNLHVSPFGGEAVFTQKATFNKAGHEYRRPSLAFERLRLVLLPVLFTFLHFFLLHFFLTSLLFFSSHSTFCSFSFISIFFFSLLFLSLNSFFSFFSPAEKL